MKLMLGECLCKIVCVCTMVRTRLSYRCGVRSSPPSTSYLPAMVPLDPWVSLGVGVGVREEKRRWLEVFA